MSLEQKRYFTSGKEYERQRIQKVALNWIDEMRGHDGECNCRHDANILQQFIEHNDFNEIEDDDDE
jgi:hypothetical protein